ncbi:hypothetical protein HDU86_007209 [Geranomyces michiganensis]|nr:hypothetical protein HDU86_007209 [Geranomyces michiganensis]
MSDDDLPPPLEDMSAMLHRYQKRAPSKHHASDVQTDKSLLDPAPTVSSAPAPKKQPFGFKKGFLNDLSTPKTGGPQQRDKPLTLVKPKAKPEDGLRLSEVQDAMRGSMSLLDRQDPIFQRAASEMSKNPQAAAKKYARERPDIMEALREFAGLLGDKLGSMDGGASAAEK